MSSTRMRGLSEAYGSWKIIWTFELGVARASGGSVATVVALEQHRAVDGGMHAGDHATERRLAAAGFADQADDLAARDDEIDVVDRVHDLVLLRGARAGATVDAMPSGCVEASGRSASIRDAVR